MSGPDQIEAPLRADWQMDTNEDKAPAAKEAQSFRLDDLLHGGLKHAPEGELRVTGINADSRAIEPGDAFFALPGAKVHGNRFIADAVARGASVIVTDQPPETDPGVPVIELTDVRAGYARAAVRRYAPQPAVSVAVTGTNGKTSVASFVRQFWAAAGIKAASLGTLGVETAEGITPGSLTTPDALSLHRDLNLLKRQGIDHVALEASSHGLDQRRLDGLRFKAVAFTNLNRDHLDYHETMEAYAEAKLRLFRNLAADGASAVVNADDPEGMPFLFAALDRGLSPMTIGREGAWLEMTSIANEGYGQRVKGKLVGEPVDFLLPLTGEFQVYNAVTALGLAVATGVPKEKALETIEHLKGARGRLELVAEHNGAAIFVDYSHKPVALESALASLRPYARGKLHVVFGAGGDRDKGKRPMMGEVAGRMADGVIVTDDNPRTEDAATIRGEIIAAVPSAREIGDRRIAIETAIKALSPGDVLLVAGKGHEDYQIVGTQKHHFSDHEAIAEALRDS